MTGSPPDNYPAAEVFHPAEITCRDRRDAGSADGAQARALQVKGGSAAIPMDEDAARLRAAARRHRARHVLLASWRKGAAARRVNSTATPAGGMVLIPLLL